MGSKYNRGTYINGKLLELTLKERGIFRHELADMVGVHRNTIGNAIKLNRIERKEKAFEICKVLKIHPDLLLDENVSIIEGNSSIKINEKNFDNYFFLFDCVDPEPTESISFIREFFSYDSNYFVNLDDKTLKILYSKIRTYRSKLLKPIHDEYVESVKSDAENIRFDDDLNK